MGPLQESGWVLPKRLLPLQVSVWLWDGLRLDLCCCSAAANCPALAATIRLCFMICTVHQLCSNCSRAGLGQDNGNSGQAV